MKLAALAVLIVCVSAIDTEFEGYFHYQNLDLSSQINGGNPCGPIGKEFTLPDGKPFWFWPPNDVAVPSVLAREHLLKDIVLLDSEMDGFWTAYNAHSCVQHFSRNASTDTYLRNVTTGGGSDPSDCESSPHPRGWIFEHHEEHGDYISTTADIITAFNPFQLPPHEIMKACEQNSDCFGFTVSQGGGSGALLKGICSGRRQWIAAPGQFAQGQ
jgi:hypothetical protein